MAARTSKQPAGLTIWDLFRLPGQELRGPEGYVSRTRVWFTHWHTCTPLTLPQLTHPPGLRSPLLRIRHTRWVGSWHGGFRGTGKCRRRRRLQPHAP